MTLVKSMNVAIPFTRQANEHVGRALAAGLIEGKKKFFSSSLTWLHVPHCRLQAVERCTIHLSDSEPEVELKYSLGVDQHMYTG